MSPRSLKQARNERARICTFSPEPFSTSLERLKGDEGDLREEKASGSGFRGFLRVVVSLRGTGPGMVNSTSLLSSQGRSYKMARPLTGVPRLVRTAVCGGVLPARAVHTSPTFLGPAGDPKVPADDTKTGGTGFFGVRLPLPATLPPLTVPGIILRVKGSQRRRPDSFTIRTTLQTRRTREIRP